MIKSPALFFAMVKYFNIEFQRLRNFLLLILLLCIKIFPQVKSDSSVSITISAVGDLMCHSVQYQYAETQNDTFNFNPVYRIVKQYLSSSDFTVGNLETVVAGKAKRYSGYPLFNSPDEYIDALKNTGFDLLFTANNHALDRGEYGVLRTIEILEKNKINYDGTFVSQRDRDSIRIYDIKSVKVAFLAYTYGTNGNIVPKDKPYLINKIDFNLIQKDIQEARIKNADVVLVYFHFGTEYKREPDKFQKVVVDSTIKYGADIIIGSHPHVIEPMKMFKTNKGLLDSGLVAYSLGNFFTNQRWRYSDGGMILNISITKIYPTNKIFISKIDYIPTWTYKGKIDSKNEYVVIPSQNIMLNDIFSYLSKADFQKMIQSFKDTKEILERYGLKLPYYSN
jgi:poly-gamma-glutamate capsule biosynthesis protein CapA/YwtB (metallophosphatase superfamily)